jgi:hypothetical protein
LGVYPYLCIGTQKQNTMITTYYTFYENIILNAIDLESFNIDTKDLNGKQQIDEVYSIFLREYGHEITRQGSEKKAFNSYLSGLPTVLTVPFMNYHILRNAKDKGFNLTTEKEEEDFLNNYFTNLAVAFFDLKENL